jgi:hypothetical protein
MRYVKSLRALLVLSFLALLVLSLLALLVRQLCLSARTQVPSPRARGEGACFRFSTYFFFLCAQVPPPRARGKGVCFFFLRNFFSSRTQVPSPRARGEGVYFLRACQGYSVSGLPVRAARQVCVSVCTFVVVKRVRMI